MRRTRTVEFLADDDGALKRVVQLSDGRQYVHRCTREVFEAVAFAYEDGQGHTMEEIADALNAPFTQVNVAVEFLKERGVIEVRAKRKSYAASGCIFEDAMIEYHALLEQLRGTRSSD
jgi:hypothetical protein